MYILGIVGYTHDSACALIKDGEVRILLEEERLSREKHTWKYPKNAIEQCLRFEGITIKDIDKITFFWVPFKEFSDNLIHFLRFFPRTLNLLRTPSGGEELSFFSRVREMTAISSKIKAHFNLDRLPPVEFIEHHLCHAASAFFLSPFEEAAILTIDGRGESTSTLMCMGRGNKIKKLKEIRIPHSLGCIYSAVTGYLGFKPFFDEWKVMGMAAYGKDTYVSRLEDIIRFNGDGSYRLNLKYFKFHTHGQQVWLSDLFMKKFGLPRAQGGAYEQRHFDIAFAAQSIIERAGMHLANYLYSITQTPNLCLTGGVILNCLMNRRIAENSPFQNFFFQPIASDAGTSMGSALYYYHQKLNRKRRFILDSVYLGIGFSDEEIKKALDEKKVHYIRSNNIARETARYIAEGKIVGWFQGRMEAGPRALGNRSIVVTPLDPNMKDRLNARVKKREFFRPFAPSVLEERAGEYFEIPKGQLSPYMILVGEVKKEKREVIPAVTHVDGTARVHTVNKETNPLYWQLIAEFEKITGVGVVLNTSFNENEPIVCTPEEAINCFLRTDFDVLAIGNFLVVKK